MQRNEHGWHADKYEQIHTKDYQHTQIITVLFSHQLGTIWFVQTCVELLYADTMPGEHVTDCVDF